MQHAGLDVSVGGLLDAFWLALQPGFRLEVLSAAKEIAGPDVPHDDGDSQGAARIAERKPVTSAEQKINESQSQQQRDAHQDAARSLGVFAAGAVEGEKETSPASPLRIPAGAALGSRLALMRSLRPLRSHFRNRQVQELNEEATADATAQAGGTLMPILEPRLERWYELVLVADCVPSMDVWYETMVEFEGVARNAGVFRDIRHYRLLWKSADVANVLSTDRAVLLNSDGVSFPATTLAQTNVRRLIFLATNGSAMHWTDGRMTELLAVWSKQCSIAIVHMLPERLWHQVRTGEPELLMTTLTRGAPAALLDAAAGWWDDDLQDSAGDLVKRIPGAVPILPLDPMWMKKWARMQMGGGQRVPGIIVRKRTDKDSHALPEQKTSEDWGKAVASFTRNCTPEARNLSVYLSQGTFTLPVARLVQTAKLGEASSQTQLAEILLSGLVQRTTPANAMIPREWVEYRFHPEAAKVLVRGLRESDAQDIAAALSTHIERYWGKPVDFRALVYDSKGILSIPQWAQPFAQLGRSLFQILPAVLPTWPSLVEEYNQIRRTETASRIRTGHMTTVVDKMRKISTENKNFDALLRLTDKDRGWRLAAYAFIYESSETTYFKPLIESLLKYHATTRPAQSSEDNRPFGDYWGLLALERVTTNTRVTLDHAKALDDLNRTMSGIPLDADRRAVLDRIRLQVPKTFATSVNVSAVAPIRVFVSCSSKDALIARRLMDRLYLLDREGLSSTSSSLELSISSADEFQHIVDVQLSGSDLFLALISPAYLSSPWAPAELKRAQTSSIKIVPVLLQRVDSISLAAYQMLPRNGVPINQWESTDTALDEIVPELRKIYVEVRDSIAARHMSFADLLSEIPADRSMLRSWIEEMETPDGHHVLIVTGESSSGKSFTREILSQFSKAGRFQLVSLDLTYAPEIRGAEDLLRAIGMQAAWDVASLPNRGRTLLRAYHKQGIDWLLASLKRRRDNLVLVLDGLGSVDLTQDIRTFIDRLAGITFPSNLYLVLIDAPTGSIQLQSLKNAKVELLGLTSEESRKAPRLEVLVVGTGSYELPISVQKAALEVGSAVGRLDYRLITGGWAGVDHLAARAFTEASRDRETSPHDRLLQVVEGNQNPDFKGGAIQRVEPGAGYSECIRRADIVILIGGAGGTWVAFRHALAANRPVIPLLKTGSDAEAAGMLLLALGQDVVRELVTADFGDEVVAAHSGRLIERYLAAHDKKQSKQSIDNSNLLWMVDTILPTASLYLRKQSGYDHEADLIRDEFRIKKMLNSVYMRLVRTLIESRDRTWRVAGYLAIEARASEDYFESLLASQDFEEKEALGNIETRPLWRWLVAASRLVETYTKRAPSNLLNRLRQLSQKLQSHPEVDPGGECKRLLRSIIETLGGGEPTPALGGSPPPHPVATNKVILTIAAPTVVEELAILKAYTRFGEDWPVVQVQWPDSAEELVRYLREAVGLLDRGYGTADGAHDFSANVPGIIASIPRDRRRAEETIPSMVKRVRNLSERQRINAITGFLRCANAMIHHSAAYYTRWTGLKALEVQAPAAWTALSGSTESILAAVLGQPGESLVSVRLRRVAGVWIQEQSSPGMYIWFPQGFARDIVRSFHNLSMDEILWWAIPQLEYNAGSHGVKELPEAYSEDWLFDKTSSE